MTRPKNCGRAHPSCGCYCDACSRACRAFPDLVEALEALVDDTPYHCDAQTCECEDYNEHGQCCHTRAHAALAKAKGTT